MRKKIIITVLVCGLLAISVAVGVALTSRDSGGEPTPAQSAVPSVVPSASPSPPLSEVRVFEESIEDAETKNPVVALVPKQTLYWRLELLGSGKQDGKLVIDTTVYLKPGQDKQAMIRKQRPFIVRWLTSIGQKPGTYILQVRTEAPHVY